MVINSTLHNHCTMCDGKSTADEMIQAAIAAGFTDFGMSCHGYAPFDPEYSMPSESFYIDAMNQLKKKYDGKIRVYTGVEEDCFAPSSCPELYDYIIGDVHYAKNSRTGELTAIDGSAEEFALARDTIYKGSAMNLIKEYYENMVKAAEKKPDILGHFDLIVKNNRDGCFFDEQSGEYMETASQALAECCALGVIFEVNTGAVVKGKRELPYPAPFLLEKLCGLGGRITLSADCHDARYITGGFDAALDIIKEAGFRRLCIWENGVFTEKNIDAAAPQRKFR